jgi:hypothetical protein
MRRLVAVMSCLFVSLTLAPVAAAQEGRRDPFRPLVTEGDESGAVPSGVGTSEPSTSTGTDTSGRDGTVSEGSPNTGMPASEWTAIAYMLIVLGTAGVTLARLRRPVAVVPRARRRS